MPSQTYVDLGRRFVDYEARDISALTLRLLGDSSDRATIGWDEALRSRCVVVLGEPGCGKTTESLATVVALRRSGGHAFHRAVSDLCGSGTPLVSQLDRAALQAWRASDADCVFALDSLDEARNAGAALGVAVDRLATELEAEWSRVRVVLTCRTAEWWPEDDLAALEPYFRAGGTRLHSEAGGAPSPTAAVPRVRKGDAPGESAPPVRVVRMAALSEDQALALARHLGAKEPARLRYEVRRSEAWALLERPADVAWLVRSWNRRGTVGTLTQLMEDNVAARLEETRRSRRRVSVLSAANAARAAREIALCATLTGERRVRVAASPPCAAADGLDAAAALPWMQARELAEFTERAIFVDDGQGARRVHHQAVEEFLAAGALRDAIGQTHVGVAAAAFLVREQYGRRVVPPSLRGVAGWAASHDDELFGALLDADPFVLMEAGDPESIAPELRRQALARIFEELDRLPWRREGADHASIARFACPELGELVRQRLAGDARRGRALALRLVWHGRLGSNASDALRFATRAGTDAELSGLAIRAAAAAGSPEVRERVVGLALRGQMPRTDLLFEVADELYPDHITPRELGEGLVAWAASENKAARSEVSHWSWLLDRTYDPERHEVLASVAGPALLRLVQSIPARRQGVTATVVRLAVILRAVLARRLRGGSPSPETLATWAPWVWALARVREAAGPDFYVHGRIDELLGHKEVRRHSLRWLVQNRVRAECDDPARPFDAFREEPHEIWDRRAGDVAWRLEELRSAASDRERLLWFGLAYQAAGIDDVERVEATASDYPELEGELARIRARRAAPPDPQLAELDREEREIEAERASREARNREELRSLVRNIREGAHDGALRFLVERIEEDERGRWGHSDWRSLAAPFGEDVAEAARAGLKLAWRRFRPMLPHERARPNEVEWFVPVGLTGLNIAFADGLDPLAMTSEDVERATAFALCEINDFPSWFGALADARPEPVRRVLDDVLSAELGGRGASPERYVLDNLGYRDKRIRRLATPALLRILEASSPTEATALERAIAALEPTAEERPRLVALARAGATLQGDDAGGVWWRCLATLDAGAAASMLNAAAREGSAPEALLAAVASFDWRTSGLAAPDLAEIVLSTYRVVAPNADLRRPSGVTYSPGTRDEAERRRSGLVSYLAGIPGEATYRALVALADEPLVADHRDWFASLAHERAERDSERPMPDLSAAGAFVTGRRDGPSSRPVLAVVEEPEEESELAALAPPAWLVRTPAHQTPTVGAATPPNEPQPTTASLVATRVGGPAKAFICYSHEDEEHRKMLVRSLSMMQRQGLIESWDDRKIAAGDEWRGNVSRAMEEADLVLLLISADFVASDYCWDVELARAMARHDEGSARVVPIFVRDCDWEGAPFARLQGVPDPARPIARRRSRDEAWTEVARAIRAALVRGE